VNETDPCGEPVSRIHRLAARVSYVRDLLACAPAARWTAITCLAVFLVLQVCSRVECVRGYTFAYLIWHAFGLCPDLLGAGFYWQPLTYMFLHVNWLHVLFNASAILLLGAGVEMEIGSRRFLRLLLLGGVAGGLAWALSDLAIVRWSSGVWMAPAWLQQLATRAAAHRVVTVEGHAICLGASGGVFGLIGACAALFPRQRMLVFLVWPVRTRRLAIVLGLAAVAFMVTGHGGNVAHLTHLVGGVAGYAYGRRLAGQGWGDA
jgi:membrane associated rhomboid family serine protease